VLGAVIGLQKVLVHMINSDTLRCRKVFKAAHHCLRSLLEATVDLKELVDSSETDESHSESGSDDNEDDDGDSDSKDVCLLLLNINSKQAKVVSSFDKLSMIALSNLSFFENECQLSVLGDGTGHM
jgi:hypothetical protein